MGWNERSDPDMRTANFCDVYREGVYTASRARHICMLRDNWPVIDWREPIGLQERLEGRSFP